jgi:hypothetical protein
MNASRITVVALVVIVVAAAFVGYAIRDGGSASTSETIPQASAEQLAAAGLDELPIAPQSRRVDLAVPSFSKPTEVTNPLFPISRLHSAILNGTVDGEPFKVETTLLPGTRVIQWPPGRTTETLVSQYVAYSGGRIKEVALDFYAQDDEGAVWYFGEDVFNYEDGVIADRDGTWLAGKDGPAAMIMPSDPQVGDVYLPENIPGMVFEQVTVRPVDRPLVGPRGPIEGGIVAEELHQDGAREDKVFAPGYGEFFTGAEGDVEAMALAVPTDALPGPAPAGTRNLLRAAPPRLKAPLRDALRRRSALEARLAALDIELRYRPPAEIDRERFEVWSDRFALDKKAGNDAAAAGDLAVMEWIRDRFWHTLEPLEQTRLNARLVRLRNSL